jgi:hypothetical protein
VPKKEKKRKVMSAPPRTTNVAEMEMAIKSNQIMPFWERESNTRQGAKMKIIKSVIDFRSISLNFPITYPRAAIAKTGNTILVTSIKRIVSNPH